MRAMTALLLLISLTGTAWAGGGDHDADEAKDGNANKVEVCHKPGPHQKTLRISADALDAHLKHGDKKGACGAGDQDLVGQPARSSATPAPAPSPSR